MSIFAIRPKARAIPDISSDPIQEDERLARAEHHRLASKLGVASMVSLKVPSVLPVLKEEGCRLYNTSAVERWMDKKGYWKWYGLRAVDATHAFKIHRVTAHGYPTLYGAGGQRWQVYDKIVPAEVLLTVERIADRLSAEALFFVAAVDDHPDPFLAVMSAHDEKNTLYVIERWDEPGFRG